MDALYGNSAIYIGDPEKGKYMVKNNLTRITIAKLKLKKLNLAMGNSCLFPFSILLLQFNYSNKTSN
jgi:hypothetical protein